MRIVGGRPILVPRSGICNTFTGQEKLQEPHGALEGFLVHKETTPSIGGPCMAPPICWGMAQLLRDWVPLHLCSQGSRVWSKYKVAQQCPNRTARLSRLCRHSHCTQSLPGLSLDSQMNWKVFSNPQTLQIPGILDSTNELVLIPMTRQGNRKRNFQSVEVSNKSTLSEQKA